MKLNKLHRIVEAIEVIDEETNTDNLSAIVDALVGVAFSKEDAGEIKSYFEDIAVD